MATPSDVLKAAVSQLGKTELPAGSNNTPYGAWYGMNGQPWCAMFVSWCFAQASASSLVAASTPKGFSYCEYGLQWFARQGRVVATANAQPGDVVFYQFDSDPESDHVGIVESVDRAAGTLTAIEGNTSSGVAGSQDNGGGVFRRVRSFSVVKGVARPAYAAPAPPTPSTSSPTPPAVHQSGQLAEDGQFGPLTCKALQRALGVMPDGIFGPGTKRALQRKLGVAPDGAVGPITIRALQRHVGAGVDGQWGPDTTRHLQHALNMGSF